MKGRRAIRKHIDLKEYKEITNFKNTKEALKNIKLELSKVPDIKDIRKVMINREEKIVYMYWLNFKICI